VIKDAGYRLDRAPAGTRVSRELVLEALATAATPTSAYDLRDLLSARLGRVVSPNSVYRILHALAEEGRALRIESSRCWILVEPTGLAELMLLCSACRSVQTIPCPPEVDRLLTLGRKRGFTTERLVLEVLGLCAGCRPSPAEPLS
jgi:Fur family zinc uptake transcriptional regulator